MGKEYHVAVVGATGAVGTRMIELLAETSLPIASVRLLASKRSAGQEIQFKGQPLIVEELVPESFEGIDLALFSAGGSISEKFAPEAVKRGAVVVHFSNSQVALANNSVAWEKSSSHFKTTCPFPSYPP